MQAQTLAWLKENGYFGDCDVVSIGGSTKGIADENVDIRNFLLDQIRISHDLHGAKNAIIIHHSDCGAYKTYAFANPAEEETRQTEDMNKTEQIILKEFPDMTIIKVWAKMNDENGESVTFTRL
jgi:hypothetical protein